MGDVAIATEALVAIDEHLGAAGRLAGLERHAAEVPQPIGRRIVCWACPAGRVRVVTVSRGKIVRVDGHAVIRIIGIRK
jgi:hypothetical protein